MEIIEIANRAGSQDAGRLCLIRSSRTPIPRRTDRLYDMEEGLGMTKVTDILQAGEKYLDGEQYQAVKLLFSSIANWARLETPLAPHCQPGRCGERANGWASTSGFGRGQWMVRAFYQSGVVLENDLPHHRLPLLYKCRKRRERCRRAHRDFFNERRVRPHPSCAQVVRRVHDRRFVAGHAAPTQEMLQLTIPPS